MPIPEPQLDTWSHRGSVTQSSATYQTIRTALLSPDASYAAKDKSVFLQGSYGNDTNVFGVESDVDTVICLDSIFNYDITGLPADQQAAFRTIHGAAGYTFDEFNRGVSTRLSSAFGSDAKFGTKAYKIKANGSRRNADVVACYQHRRYTRFINSSDCSYVKGIIIPTPSAGYIINYPSVHSANCTAKHQATNEWFKPVVRIFKNMRNHLVGKGTIASDVAPSYYIECLVYNVPPDKFGQNYATSFCNCLNWLNQADRTKLLCANHEYILFGTRNVQWTAEKCDLFLSSLVTLWNSWGNS